MLTRIYVIVMLLAALPVWSQGGTNGTGGSAMQTPPPVSGEAYPMAVGSEARSNYLRAGVVLTTAYNDNVLTGIGSEPISDVSYTISPTIALDHTTPRLHQTLTYSPGFTFYQHMGDLNQGSQNLNLNFQYRLSPHITVTVRDTFLKTSNLLNQPFPPYGGSISGSAQSPLKAVVAPTADQLNNNANMELTYQFGRNTMIGASGTFTNLHFPNPSEAIGLSNSDSQGGSVFYSYRLSRTLYFGATYQYSRIFSYPQNEPQNETQTNAGLLFFTIYLKPNLSLSLSGGPQHYNFSQPSLRSSGSWSPAAIVSMGWQGHHTSFSALYAQVITAGEGLSGAYHSNSANASARWQLERNWTVGLTAGYAVTANVDSTMSQANPGGRSASVTASVQHPVSERVNVEFGYTRLHQSYPTIAVVSNAPNTNREYIAVSYRFTRPLGR